MRQLLFRLPVLITTIWVLTIVGVLSDTPTCLAKTNTTLTDSSEAPVFANPAQASRAEDLAAVAAEQANAEAEAAMEALEAATQNLYDARRSGDEDAYNEALQALQAAQNEVVEAMAGIAGVSVSDIAGMRGEGMGWGQIAHALGIHPGVLGLGHTKGGKNGQGAHLMFRLCEPGTSNCVFFSIEK